MYDFTIIGAGPVGLSLALALARKKKSVLVLEKKDALSEHSKAPAIWPRTQEVFSRLGVIKKFTEAGILLSELQLRDADTDTALLTLPLMKELRQETNFPHLLILPQSRTEQLLLETLTRETDTSILFAAEACEFISKSDAVEIKYMHEGSRKSCESRWLIGCDGAHSRVRENLGFAFDGETYRAKAALADIRFPENRDNTPFPQLTNKEVLAIAIRIDKNLWRLILPYPHNAAMALDSRIQRSVASIFHTDTYETVWKSEFSLHRRIASGFVSGRIVLAGDAAHLNSPVGGQGMNAGIQDTDVLSGYLIRALTEDDPGILKKYGEMRRKKISTGVNAFTNVMTKALLFREGRFVKSVLKIFSFILRCAPLRRQFLRRLAMLG